MGSVQGHFPPACSTCQAPETQTPRRKGEPLGYRPLVPNRAELGWLPQHASTRRRGNLCGNGWEQLPSWVCPLLSGSRETYLKYFLLSSAKAATEAPPPGQPPTSSAKAPVSSGWSLAGVSVSPMKKLRLGKVTGSLQPMAACVKLVLPSCAKCILGAITQSQLLLHGLGP